MIKTNLLKIEIIAVGTELLTPYHQDTNSLYLSRRLNDLGMNVRFKSIVGDSRDDLLECIRNARSRSDLIFACGGLGPTQDDRTKEAFAAAFGKKLIFQPKILSEIEKRFRKRGLQMTDSNKKQATIPEGSEILPNNHGTAPGIWLEDGKNLIILLPGPPSELIPMFENHVMPRLQEYRSGFRARIALKLTSLPESQVETEISDCYPQNPDANLTILAVPGQIEIHLSSFSQSSQADAEARLAEIKEPISIRLGDNIFSESGEDLEGVIGSQLQAADSTLSVAESCTGGLLGHRITNVSGSSRYFIMGVQAYSDAAKIQLLNIPSELIARHGAVSHEVALTMAAGIRARSGSDFSLAITGIAGPTGGTQEKPVGLVFTALAWDNGAEVKRNYFLGSRQTIKFRSAQKALDMLRRHLMQRTES